MPRSAVVASWELALRLRQRRDQMGIDVATLTREMSFSRNYWSAVENERKVLSAARLIKILDLFEFDQEARQELLELRELTKQHGWWTTYSGLLSPELQRLYGLEHGAQGMRTYENLLVPGLLQIADYSRAMMLPDVTVRRVDVEQLVEVRLRRQQRLSGDDPLRLTAVISQAVLWQEIGGPAILKRQLEHLARMIEEHPDTLDLRVIPFTTTWCPLFGSATIHVIDFTSPRLPIVVWQETVTAQGIIDDPRQVRDFDAAYSDALRIAPSAQESFQIINNRIKELA